MRKKPDLDQEQARLDGEDAIERLAVLSRAITAVTEAESLVTSLANQLRQAKRQLKERKWVMQGLILEQKRRTGQSPPANGEKPPGKRS